MTTGRPCGDAVDFALNATAKRRGPCTVRPCVRELGIREGALHFQFPAAPGESSRASPQHRPRELGLAHPAAT
jgi:hypothetical protein